MKCNKTLKLHGKEYLFKSDEDLNKFLYNNRERLGLSTENFMRFSLDFTSEYSAQGETLALLAKANVRKEKRKTFSEHKNRTIGQSGEKNEGGGKTTITGTNVQRQYNMAGKQIVRDMERDEFKEVQIKEWLDKGVYKNRNTAEQVIEEMFKEWDASAELGTELHTIPEMIFDAEGVVNTQEVIEKFRKDHPNSTISDKVISNAIDEVLRIKEAINKYHPGNNKFYSEVVVETENPDGNKCKGIIDLLVIDEQGNPHIYDFKTSSKNITQFGNIKTLSYKYQLGFYRQILGALGLNVSKTTLGIIPFELKGIDYENKTLEDVSISPIDILSNDLNLKIGQGVYFNDLDRILPISLPKFQIGSDFIGKSSEILINALSYEPKLSANPSDVGKFMRTPYLYKTTKDGKRKFFYNRISDKYIYADNDEEGKQKVAEYLDMLEKNNINAAAMISGKLAAFISGDDNYIEKRSKNQLGFSPSMFLEYQRSGWEINTDFEHLGVLLLYNPVLKVVDVINITSNDITADYELSEGSTILGNFLPDTKVSDSKIISSNYGNVELIRSMFIINDILSESELLNGYKIGTFKVMSHTGSRAFTQNDIMLKHSFNKLVSEVNKKYKNESKPEIINKLKDAEFEKIEDRIARTLDAIIKNDENALIGAEKHLEAFTSTKTKNIQDRLDNLLDELANQGKVNVTTKDFDTPLQQLGMIVARARQHYGGLDYELKPGDENKWGMTGRTIHTQLRTHAVDPFTQSFEREIITRRDAVIKRDMADFSAKVRVATKPIAENSISLTTGMNMFDSMFEPGKNGEKFDKEFRVKNPYDPNSRLDSKQREYLKFFLSEMHKYLNPNTKGDINTEEAQELIASGVWFQIPLIYGEFVNKITAEGNIVNGIKKEWTQYKDKITNINEQISTQQIQNEEYQFKYFDNIVNSTKINVEDRRQVIEKTGIDGYSRDLSSILMTVAYKAKMEQVTKELLPIVRASLIFHNGFISINKTGAENFQEYLIKYLQTAVFGKRHIEPNQKQIAAVVTATSGVLAKATLGMNAVSIWKENVQGLYNNILNISSAAFGIDPPSLKDLMFGYSQVTGMMAKDLNNIGKIDCLAQMFPGILASGVRNSANELSALGRGGKMLQGDLFMKLNMAPDRLNRIAPLIGFMKKDGCYDAHVFDPKTQTLQYDWKKDARFNLLVKYGKNSTKVPASEKEKYEKQRGMYDYLIREARREGYCNPDGSPLTIDSDVPFAYSANQIATIKDVIAQAHGDMSPDVKSQFQQGLWGGMLTMFKTWLPTKINRYWVKGGYRNQGEVKPIMVDGKQQYRHSILDEDGNEIDVIINDNPEGGIIHTEFVESYNQGIFASLAQAKKYYDKYGLKGGYDEIMNDPVVRKNLKYLLSDLFAVFCLFLIGQLFIDFATMEKDYGTTITRMAKAPFQAPVDNNPLNILSTVLGSTEPPAIAMAGKWLNSITNVVVRPSIENLDKVVSNISVYKQAADMYNSLGKE